MLTIYTRTNVHHHSFSASAFRVANWIRHFAVSNVISSLALIQFFAGRRSLSKARGSRSRRLSVPTPSPSRPVCPQRTSTPLVLLIYDPKAEQTRKPVTQDMSFLSTLPPTDVAIAMVEHGVVKHQTRLDKVFFKAVLAGMFLSTGGLLLEIVEGGSTGLNDSNPGLVKILGGAVFPVGLVMYVLFFICLFFGHCSNCLAV